MLAAIFEYSNKYIYIFYTRFSALGGSFFDLALPPFSLACVPGICKSLYKENLLACVPGENDPANQLTDFFNY